MRSSHHNPETTTIKPKNHGQGEPGARDVDEGADLVGAVPANAIVADRLAAAMSEGAASEG